MIKDLFSRLTRSKKDSKRIAHQQMQKAVKKLQATADKHGFGFFAALIFDEDGKSYIKLNTDRDQPCVEVGFQAVLVGAFSNIKPAHICGWVEAMHQQNSVVYEMLHLALTGDVENVSVGNNETISQTRH